MEDHDQTNQWEFSKTDKADWTCHKYHVQRALVQFYIQITGNMTEPARKKAAPAITWSFTGETGSQLVAVFFFTLEAIDLYLRP